MGQRVTIYTDGSCHGNPGPGGYAAIIFESGITKEVFGSDWRTTNNRMELKAVIEGLRVLQHASNVRIVSDSKYVVNGINSESIQSFANAPGRVNADLWREIAKLSSWHTVRATWIKGHSGNKYNEQCDRLANQRANKIEREKYTRRVVFSELLKDISTDPCALAKKYELPINTVLKYYRQYLEKYNAEGR